jgi:hypothetical protein
MASPLNTPPGSFGLTTLLNFTFRGWPADCYSAFVAEAMIAALLTPSRGYLRKRPPAPDVRRGHRSLGRRPRHTQRPADAR